MTTALMVLMVFLLGYGTIFSVYAFGKRREGREKSGAEG